MYTRSLIAPNYSFFLFGPRGTGKTTWLRNQFPKALWKNLLTDAEYLPLLSNPSLLSAEVSALPPGSWVVIDEVQKIPALLNEVHNLISIYGTQYKFAMSGSSARKLRRLEVNLLAGRAIERQFYPLTSAELGEDYALATALQRGTLPSVVTASEYANDILLAYVGTYLKQEIQQETMVTDVAAFHRFLKIAAIMNGQVVNLSAIARDASVSRSTAERYFDILVETLVGVRLPGWQPRLKVREQTTPKFYFFDPGIVHAILGNLHDLQSNLEVGPLLETLFFHELRSANSYQGAGGEFFYWRTPSGVEVDFIWSRGDKIVAFEVKNASVWRKEYGKALGDLSSLKKQVSAYGIYRGNAVLKMAWGIVYPVEVFLKKLHDGEIFSL